jgi:hypothetical protein
VIGPAHSAPSGVNEHLDARCSWPSALLLFCSRCIVQSPRPRSPSPLQRCRARCCLLLARRLLLGAPPPRLSLSSPSPAAYSPPPAAPAVRCNPEEASNFTLYGRSPPRRASVVFVLTRPCALCSVLSDLSHVSVFFYSACSLSVCVSRVASSSQPVSVSSSGLARRLLHIALHLSLAHRRALCLASQSVPSLRRQWASFPTPLLHIIYVARLLARHLGPSPPRAPGGTLRYAK